MTSHWDRHFVKELAQQVPYALILVAYVAAIGISAFVHPLLAIALIVIGVIGSSVATRFGDNEIVDVPTEPDEI